MKIEIINIQPTDKIMITYAENCDFETVQDICNYFSEQFPDNIIISNFSGLVKEITIMRQDESLITPGVKKEEDCNGYIY